MLSANYAGHSAHTPLHAPSVGAPILSAHPGQQAAQFTHQHPVPSSVLPTPPSSPPTIGMHPIESTISLLESLVAFYHQERMWVYRTRAQLEMGLFNRPDSRLDSGDGELDDDPDSPSQLQTQSASSPDSAKSPENASASPQTKWLKRKKAFNLRLEGIPSPRTVARGGISKRPHPHTLHRARQSSNLNPASVPAPSHHTGLHGSSSGALHPYPSVSLTLSGPATSFYPPAAVNTATTLTSPYLSHPSLQLPSAASQQSYVPGASTPRYVSSSIHQTHSTAQPSQSQPIHTGPLVLGGGGREPTVQILEMFERMMQARMESCERVTRMVREANRPGIGGAGVVGGANLGSVGGPVGGFGGPVGVPVGVGPQVIAGGYPQLQAMGGGESQTTTEGFPMNM